MMRAAAIWVMVLAAVPTAKAAESERELVFLAEERPVFLRLRVTTGDRPFDLTWPDSVKAIFTSLDRNGDGKLSTKEASQDAIAALVRLATAVPPPALAVQPKDGVVSTDALADALRPVLGPFRVQIGRLANGRTDALFDHLDRDKDGELTRTELAAIAGSLRPLDLDDNALISPDELEPFNSPPADARTGNMADRRPRYIALPPVVELVAGESSLRLARLLMKKYDKKPADGPGRLDSKLSLAEFAIDPDAFTSADADGDEALSMDELRRFLTTVLADLALEVAFSPDASGPATAKVAGDGSLPKGVKIRQLADGDVEFAVGRVRLDVHIDDGAFSAENARRTVLRRFKAADANKDGYVDGKELAALNAAGSPLAGLTELIDRDADGKLYEKELVAFIDRQIDAARGRLVLTVSDQGRAIFGILDLDRDRRLSAREVMRTVDRVTSWDANADGRVTADEIPYHFQVTIARGELLGVAGDDRAGVAVRSMAAAKPAGPEAGPDWFRLMDRNHDGDVSRREFLGTREEFDRLDRDNDGLIDAEEAKRAAEKGKRIDEGGS